MYFRLSKVRDRVQGAAAAMDGKSWQRGGDWLCPKLSCRNINFAFRSICNLCGVARPAGVSGKGASSGSWGCGMRPGGRTNTTAIGKKDFQTVRVEMSVDDWKKWCKFKECLENRQLNETRKVSTAAISASFCGNTSLTMSCETNVKSWLIDSVLLDIWLAHITTLLTMFLMSRDKV